MRNLTTSARALISIALFAIALTGAAGSWLWYAFPPPPQPSERVQYLEQYVNLVQVIGVGVVVALVSVIIPLMLPEARDRFERYKESRVAYSRAKTAVLYLCDRVVNVDREEAFRLVEEAHRELHFAETFEDMIIKKGYLRWFGNPTLWVLYNYWQIVAVAEVLRLLPIDWNTAEGKNMLRAHLTKALAVVHARFGKRGENCKGQMWRLEDGSRFREEDLLERKIRETLTLPDERLSRHEK